MKHLRSILLAFSAATLVAATLAFTSTSVSAAPNPGATPPTIYGEPRVGSTLTATRGGWYNTAGLGTGGEKVFYGWKWYRDGVQIPGLDGRSNKYVPVAADIGSRISVAVVAVQFPHPAVTGPRSAETNPVLPGIITAGFPSVTGKRQAGSTLTAQPGTGWSPAPMGGFNYAWYVDGAFVHGCTTNVLTSCSFRPSNFSESQLHLIASDVGKQVRVVVLGSKDGYISKPKTAVAGYIQPAPPPT